MVLHFRKEVAGARRNFSPGVAGSFSLVLASLVGKKTEQMAPSGGVVRLLTVEAILNSNRFQPLCKRYVFRCEASWCLVWRNKIAYETEIIYVIVSSAIFWHQRMLSCRHKVPRVFSWKWGLICHHAIHTLLNLLRAQRPQFYFWSLWATQFQQPGGQITQ